MPVVIRPIVADRPLICLSESSDETTPASAWRERRVRPRKPRIDSVVSGGVLVSGTGPLSAQVDTIRTRRVVAGSIQSVNQVRQTLINDGLGNAFVAAAPDRDRGMIAKSQDGVARVLQKQFWILGLEVIVLRGCPEIIPDQLAVFVRQIVETLLPYSGPPSSG